MGDNRLTRDDLTSSALPSFVVVEGPIGAGKTTLSRLLAETFSSDLLLESPDTNPFLPRFYAGEKNAALATQLFFLMQRSQQLEQLRHNDLFTRRRVADFIIDKDRLFAEVTLDSDEMALYDQVYQHVTLDAPRPDLVVYLQAPVETLMERVRRRGLEMEKAIDIDYLQELNESYSRFFHYYDASPLLIVNTQDLDWVNRVEDYNDLVRYLLTVHNGRHYYNPHSRI